MSESVPASVWSGSFTLMGVEMKCHVLDNGERVIEEDSVHRFIEAMEGPDAVLDHDEIMAFMRWQKGMRP